jgi:DNA-directed RNA polymerase specialized sigma24 family protein
MSYRAEHLPTSGRETVSSWDNESFLTLCTQYFDPLAQHPALRKLDPDTAREVIGETWIRVLEAGPTFEYRGDAAFWGWLSTILKSVIADRLKRQGCIKRTAQRTAISIHQEISSADGATCELIEAISSDFDKDLTDRAQRELVLEVGEQCLSNSQLELLWCRMSNEPFEGRSKSWIDTNWHRLKKKLIKAFQERQKH